MSVNKKIVSQNQLANHKAGTHVALDHLSQGCVHNINNIRTGGELIETPLRERAKC